MRRLASSSTSKPRSWKQRDSSSLPPGRPLCARRRAACCSVGCMATHLVARVEVWGGRRGEEGVGGEGEGLKRGWC